MVFCLVCGLTVCIFIVIFYIYCSLLPCYRGRGPACPRTRSFGREKGKFSCFQSSFSKCIQHIKVYHSSVYYIHASYFLIWKFIFFSCFDMIFQPPPTPKHSGKYKITWYCLAFPNTFYIIYTSCFPLRFVLFIFPPKNQLSLSCKLLFPLSTPTFSLQHKFQHLFALSNFLVTPSYAHI